jgi:hypothetical protein
MKDFAGKIAVVTGGGAGMGRELVRQLVAAVDTGDNKAASMFSGRLYEKPRAHREAHWGVRAACPVSTSYSSLALRIRETRSRDKKTAPLSGDWQANSPRRQPVATQRTARGPATAMRATATKPAVNGSSLRAARPYR